MNPMATLREDGFTLTWSPVYEGSEYLVFLERCDRQYLETGGVDCERILSENVTLATPDPTTNIAAVADSVQLVSEKVLDLCRFYYNVRIDALGADARMLFRETAVLAKLVKPLATVVKNNIPHLFLPTRADALASYSRTKNMGIIFSCGREIALASNPIIV